MVGTEEYQMVGPTRTQDMQAQYTGCHKHGSETYCVDSTGEDVQVLTDVVNDGGDEHANGHGETSEEPAGSGEHCHFHAGVQYIVPVKLRCLKQVNNSVQTLCWRQQKQWNSALRVYAS